MGFGRPCGFQALHKGQDSCLCSSLSSQHRTEPCCSLAHMMEELQGVKRERICAWLETEQLGWCGAGILARSVWAPRALMGEAALGRRG